MAALAGPETFPVYIASVMRSAQCSQTRATRALRTESYEALAHRLVFSKGSLDKS
eukprot:CAMPEP_0205934758 /NCGR_PEP_ID=MMETSP1325-20131115/37296_1 /ASSEMBLY_ACC=CAM_ASM_000708 /TAXON_ID=236786 /ORGANISM="Florenciella sp., Strain RCC1007" /LENGTH=54 /DNA_ID=CAMNT_0053304781 /DNA_START=19 /DNA_END=179 /DNA_ORIENTATION=+